DTVVGEPFLHQFRGVLRIVALLENEVGQIPPIRPHAGNQAFFEDLAVELSVQATIDTDKFADAIHRHKAPNHKTSTAILGRRLYMMRLALHTGTLPASLAPVRPQTVDFGLFGPNDAFPIVWCPMLVFAGEVEAPRHMALLKERLFDL